MLDSSRLVKMQHGIELIGSSRAWAGNERFSSHELRAKAVSSMKEQGAMREMFQPS
jgi:hypothetical protein